MLRNIASVQSIWKLSALFTTIFNLGTVLALTIVVATSGVDITGVSAEEKGAITSSWNGTALQYNDNGLALATVITGWITWAFALARYANCPFLVS